MQNLVRQRAARSSVEKSRGPITPIVLPDYVKGEDSADVLMLYYNDGHVAPASSPEVGVWTNRNPYWLIPGYIVEDGKVRLLSGVNLKLHCMFLVRV